MKKLIRKDDRDTCTEADVVAALQPGKGSVLLCVYNGAATFAVCHDGMWWFSGLRAYGKHTMTTGLDNFVRRLAEPGLCEYFLFDSENEAFEYITANNLKVGPA